MSIRKFFNIPSNRQRNIILNGCKIIQERAIEEAHSQNKKKYKEQEYRNTNCPRCFNKDIVDKISNVNGDGYVSGSFYLGTGSVYGQNHIETNSVNHCNKCGHQWKKYEFSYQFAEDVISDWLYNLNVAIEKKYTFGDYVLNILNDIPAESIWSEFKRVYDRCSYSTQHNLTLAKIRNQFKSVYDE